MRRPSRSCTACVLALAALALAACGADGRAGPARPSSSVGAPITSSPRSGDASAGSGSHLPAFAVTTRSVGRLGTILVSGKGRTLYLFAPDRHAGRSRCYALCANQWPPLLLPKGVATPVAGGEANESLLGTTRRRNGALQVTYGGWPLYWFVYDAKPGDATGQGLDSLGGLWWVMSPTGREIERR